MWYIANIFFKGFHHDNPTVAALCEERMILFQAETEEEAEAKARIFAAAEEHSYETEKGIMNWVFDSIERGYPLEADFADGTELFSRFLRPEELESLKTPF